MTAHLHDHPLFWLGTYTADGEGTGVGIEALQQEDSGTLRPIAAQAADSPSWVLAHPSLPVVYAAEEFTGKVLAFHRGEGAALVPLGHPVTLDAGACHLSIAPDGRALVAACYGSGQVVWVPLRENGAFAGVTTDAAAAVDPYGTAPLANEFEDAGFAALVPKDASAGARVSRAHQSLWLPDGRLATTDLGFDTVRVWRPRAGGLELHHQVSLPYGVGPRHMVWHESGHLHVVTEYSNEVFTLRPADSGQLKLIAGVQATADGIENGDYASEISIAARRDRLHVGIRGSNRIATLSVTDDGGVLRAVGDAETGGDWPRHHVESNDLLHVANQRSGTVTTLRLDERTGVPSKLVGSVEVGSPTSLARAT